MMTVREVSQKTGVSIRTLHHYDKLGLLPPAAVSPAGYRLYDMASLERLQHILLFRELQFPLGQIREILDRPDFDRNKALDQQIGLLKLKKEHLENLIALAAGLRLMGLPQAGLSGEREMDFGMFDQGKIDEYAREAKKAWGESPAYKEYEQKSAGRTAAQSQALGARLMELMAAFSGLDDPAGEAALKQVQAVKDFITEHYYTCTDEILAGLGRMYAGGGSMTENIDRAGGPGTADFAAKAIEAYCASSSKR